ncbi:MAG: hypothetical protein IPO63_04820 [Bacteroidetes bacterium]|nr:hypothetical protein [Bacteroidota bacterium]
MYVPRHPSPSGNYTLCEGAYITAIASTAEAYQWSNGDTNQTVQISGAGNYYVTVIDSNGCQSTSPTLNITIQPKVRIVANGPTAICTGTQLTLSSSHLAAQYNWSIGSNAASIVVSPTVNTWYFLTGTTSGGCTVNDSILIMVNQGQAVPVAAMYPINGTSNLSTDVFVSWLPGNPTGNNVYDIFLWPTSGSQPIVPTKSNYTGVNYTFSGLAPATTYNWRIKTKNGCSEANGPIFSFSTSQLPDLIVNNISAPSVAYSGTPISISWQVTNVGLGSTGANNWIDNVYLSTDTIFHPALDFFIGSSANQSALLNIQSYSSNINATLLNTIAGNYYVIIKSDGQESLLEAIESNNIKVRNTPIGILLSPVPDLRVSSVINQSNTFSSIPASPVDIPIQYTVKNQGDNGILNKTWFDDFYISNSPFFDPQTATFLGQLKNINKTVLADSSYTNTTTIRVPYYVNGVHFIYVRTDEGNSLFEGPFENNNINSNSINIILSPPPDLQTTTLTCPDTINLYQNITSVWTVLNAGPGIAAGGWNDKIYFSNDSADWNLNHATLLSSYSHTSALNNLSIYSGSSNFMIPDSISGIRYLYAKTDADSTVFEFTNESNNVRRKVSPVVVRKPDLSVTTAILPSSITIGQLITTSHTVKNNGPAPIYTSSSHRDVIVFSNDAVFSINNDVIISDIYYNDDLPVDSSKIYNRTLTMPSISPGNYFIFVATDRNNNIKENDEGNNVYLAGTIQVSLPQAPDLTTFSMNFIPDTIVTLSSYSLNASIRNIGPGVASGQWMDELFISKDSVWNSGTAFALKSETHNNYLNPNNTYSDLFTFTIPSISLLGGADSTNYFFWHRLDVNNTINEQVGENNNISKSKRVFLRDSIIILPPVDLKPIGLIISDTLDAGTPGNLTWAVQNFGPGNLSAVWSDEVYLSLDTILGATDIQLLNYSTSRLLNATASYSQNRNFTLPSVLSGSYFVFIKTNAGNIITNETNYSNNIWLARNVSNTPIKVFIKPIIPVDLQILSFNAPTNVIAGQPIYIHYSFVNNGPGTISNKNITNSIRLGSSPNIQTSAIVGSNTINFTIPPAQIYTDSIQVVIPIPTNGVFYWGVIIDDLAIIPETNESNNSQLNILTATTPPPADLIVDQITMQDSASSDSSITINWKVKNIGHYSASGVINEGIYISKDRVWDVNDPLLRNFTTNVNVAPQGEINNQATVSLTEALNGFQQIIIKTDLLNYILESNDSNNTGISEDSIFINVRELPLNLWVTDSLKNNRRLTYKIIIPDSLEGKALLVKLKGGQYNIRK